MTWIKAASVFTASNIRRNTLQGDSYDELYIFCGTSEVGRSPAVRQWIENEIAATLRALMGATSNHRRAIQRSWRLAPPRRLCKIFKLIREDLATTLGFLELPHEPIGNISPSLNALNIGNGNISRHTRLNDSRLAECFRTINQIFQQLRGDPETMLFGFDQANHAYIHETTYRSIRSLWGV